MTYQEGVRLIIELNAKVFGQAPFTSTYEYKQFNLMYPGKKRIGDYLLNHNGKHPRHEDIVNLIYDLTNEDNFEDLVRALEDVHANGDSATTSFFTEEVKSLIFLVTLQEEVNYPPPANGRNLPFWRFYEAALAKVGDVDLVEVVARTNNHGKVAPKPYANVGRIKPGYYS